MYKQIRWRIAIPFVALISLILISLGVYLTNSIRQSKLQDIEDQLTAEGYILANFILSLSGEDNLTSIDLDTQAKR